jgi:hypothetical protein
LQEADDRDRLYADHALTTRATIVRRFRVPAWLLAASVALASRPAAAEPEWGSSLILGAAGIGEQSAWERTRFYGALRGEALFFRKNRRNFGFGPALEVGTAGFSDVRFLGSAVALMPIGEFLAVSVAPGAFVRSSSQGAVAGLSGRAFFGMHAYGYGEYALNGGLVLGFDRDLGGPDENAIIVAAQVDALMLALPVVLLISWLRGSPD